MAERLSPDSPYESRFGTRKRSVGRPLGDTEPLFAVGDSVDPVVALVAKRRAYAVVHEEQRDRLKSLFNAEVKVLRRRGASRVAADAGVALKAIESSAKE